MALKGVPIFDVKQSKVNRITRVITPRGKVIHEGQGLIKVGVNLFRYLAFDYARHYTKYVGFRHAGRTQYFERDYGWLNYLCWLPVSMKRIKEIQDEEQAKKLILKLAKIK